MTNEQTSRYWLDREVEAIMQRYPTGELVVSSGISPSGSIHVGNFRELLTNHALAWGLKQAGRQVRHVHVSDDFDPLRRRYPFLPENFEQYVGWPLSVIPDPVGDCHDSYAEHYFKEFEAAAKQVGVEMEVVSSYHDLYENGRMTDSIELALANVAKIQAIFEDIAGRKLDPDWTPVQVMGDDKVLKNARVDSWDKKAQTIEGVDYTSGRAKLNWRLDWPARWGILGVKVESFSLQEHGAAGGSYDTGKEFARQIFNTEPPYPAALYANIHLPGQTKKISSSLGNTVTPAEAFEIMPPEILRYFVLRSKPDRTLYFDSGLGLYNLIDEYAKTEEAVVGGNDSEFAEAYKLASSISGHRVISSVPFSHMVAVYQAAQGNASEALEILQRTGYEGAVEAEKDVITAEFEYVKSWLEKYAPESVKFSVQDKLPDADLSAGQKTFLTELADAIEAEHDLNGQGMHDLIYAKAEVAGLKPAAAFQVLYRVILGKDSGPKAGWFLASLDHDWLLDRLRLKH